MGGHLHAMRKHGQWRAFRSFSELCTSTEIGARFSDTHYQQEETNVSAE